MTRPHLCFLQTSKTQFFKTPLMQIEVFRDSSYRNDLYFCHAFSQEARNCFKDFLAERNEKCCDKVAQ